MAVDKLIQGVSYAEIQGDTNSYLIVPFDQNGNLIPEVTVIEDRSVNTSNIILPNMQTLKGLPFKVRVVVKGEPSKTFPTVAVVGFERTLEDFDPLYGIGAGGATAMGGVESTMIRTFESTPNGWNCY